MIYLTLEAAEIYYSTRLNVEEWSAATEEEKIKALNMAEKYILKLPFSGVRNTADAVFPRDGAEAIPEQVTDAMYEEALSILSGKDNIKDMTNLHVRSSNYAGFSTTVDPNVDRPWLLYNLTSPIAWQWLCPYLIDPRTFAVRQA
jgi:hypothetical protein